MCPDRLHQRIKRYRAGPDPIRQRRDIDLDSLASKGLGKLLVSGMKVAVIAQKMKRTIGAVQARKSFLKAKGK
jgi:hypothetical protein